MWSIFFFLQHSLPCGPHTFSICVSALGFPWYRSSHRDPRKSPQLQICPHYQSDTASQPSFFHVGEQKIVRWCQIRRIWIFSIHILLIHAQQPLLSWITHPVWVYLEGNNAVSIRKCWIQCVPSLIAVAQLLSQPMNFSAHPCGLLRYRYGSL